MPNEALESIEPYREEAYREEEGTTPATIREGWSHRCRGATKSPTLRLAAVEAAEQARELRVWEGAGLRVGGGGLAGVNLG
jgi:hypothetical protein